MSPLLLNHRLAPLIAIALLVLNLLLVAARLLAPPAADDQDVPPLPDAPSIRLVDEVVPVGSQTIEDRCYAIGPLGSELQQQRAVDRLRPFVVSLRRRETAADIDRGWWVYLPPERSRQDALGTSRRLADAGVEDYYVVTSGEMENTVSLGLYESHENARVRQSRIRAIGFDAQLAVRREEAPRFWVDYRLGIEETAPWRPILRASPGALHFEIPCFD